MAGGFSIRVQHSIDDLIETIDARQRDVDAWTRHAVNETAKDVMDAEVEKISEAFDRPTRFTQNALFVRYAAKGELTAEVRFKDGFGSIPARLRDRAVSFARYPPNCSAAPNCDRMRSIVPPGMLPY
jgi:hypothetical protein